MVLRKPISIFTRFPIDFFSVKWEGEIKIRASLSYIFKVITDGGAKLTVGGKTIIDQQQCISGNSTTGLIDLEASLLLFCSARTLIVDYA
jgi:hypothetical protein